VKILGAAHVTPALTAREKVEKTAAVTLANAETAG
jgi:hypothetical protein